ncbi:MAG: flagellar motor protein MotB [Alphaproteobacteria bacterium]|nr:flagellar motor protein MotB [Alphaproteobacteria bacterium]
MKKKVKEGAPEWLVLFADLMSLLVVFFVLIISFSIQDDKKLQVVAGSMREAFGVQFERRISGMIEVDGTPVHLFTKQPALVENDKDTNYMDEDHTEQRKQGSEANTYDIKKTIIERSRQFVTAAASLRQAWQEMPELVEISNNIQMEESPEGLNIQLIDENGRSMFRQGSAQPFSRTRKLIASMAPILADLPNRISITGHTDSAILRNDNDYGQWELSSDRAAIVRRILSANGIPHDQFFEISGKADTQPLFPSDTLLAANRRVSILIMAEAPPIPIEHYNGR